VVGEASLFDCVEDSGCGTEGGGVQAEGGGHRDGFVGGDAAGVEEVVDDGEQPGGEFGVVAAEDDAGGVEDADEGEDSGGEVFGCVVEAGEGGGVSGASAGDDFVDAEFDFGEGEVFVVAGVVGEDAAGDGGDGGDGFEGC